MPCPRHGLILALIMWPMHVLDMSYTSSHKSPKCHGMNIQFISSGSNGISTITIIIMHSQFTIKQFMLYQFNDKFKHI
ncbi:hypothetical protein F383_30623 [Gossypium arboreum]|uniref:Secreted protein n=1 Tax=Gossypium arboreum TaxID=29729 RepID=A0A0B0MXJ3_GOSAR|nr:hypothetical protein F383_30623 [Gossypium arboreum]